jgi:hypothetical protein
VEEKSMVTKEEYVTDYKNLSVKLSDGSSIKGKVNLGANFKRLSDFVKHTPDKFITIVSEDASKQSKKVILVNKDYVIWAEAEE